MSTALAASTTMGTDDSLLHLLWLASPTLPVGAFSYSEGLEAATDAGTVHDEASCAAWLLNQLELVQARAELPLLAAAYRAAQAADVEALQGLNAWVLATRESSEMLQQTQQMGRSLMAWMLGLQLDTALLKPLQPPTWPVAYALAGLLRGAPLAALLQAAAFGWAENLVMAAVRGVPLGQSAGQRLLAQIVQVIPQAVEAALAAPEPIAFAPLLGITSCRHETQYSRLFRS
jgi:urease accessory protein